jgi:hypothetical protein
MTLAGVIVGFALLVYVIYNLLMDQRVWFFVAMMAHLICTGGVVYGIQNDMPWFKFKDNKGKLEVIEFFYKDMQAQWAGEGFIVSALTFSIGCLYAILSRVYNKFDSPWLTRLAVILLILLIWFL